MVVEAIDEIRVGLLGSYESALAFDWTNKDLTILALVAWRSASSLAPRPEVQTGETGSTGIIVLHTDIQSPPYKAYLQVVTTARPL